MRLRLASFETFNGDVRAVRYVAEPLGFSIYFTPLEAQFSYASFMIRPGSPCCDGLIRDWPQAVPSERHECVKCGSYVRAPGVLVLYSRATWTMPEVVESWLAPYLGVLGAVLHEPGLSSALATTVADLSEMYEAVNHNLVAYRHVWHIVTKQPKPVFAPTLTHCMNMVKSDPEPQIPRIGPHVRHIVPASLGLPNAFAPMEWPPKSRFYLRHLTRTLIIDPLYPRRVPAR